MADRLDSERLRGFRDGLTDGQTDICDSRVAFATENIEDSKVLTFTEFLKIIDRSRGLKIQFS